jgi:hydrogenase maturation factor
MQEMQNAGDLITSTHSFVCQRDSEERCLTCSDAIVSVCVLQVNHEAGLALVEVEQQIEEVDITLLESVSPGDILLVHGGVAIERSEKKGQP